jgi:multisubunit Na+/H+ antiporter MnhB subunit
LFSQFLQVALVSVMVFLFLFVFGVLVVTEPVARGFVDHAPHVLASLDLWGRDLVVTEELLRVTGFLTVFSGLYFAVTALTDETYRREFIGEILDEMRRSLAVRTVYLAARKHGATAPAG